MNLEETKKDVLDALGSIYASVDTLMEYLRTHKTSGLEIKITVDPKERVSYGVTITGEKQ